MLITPTEKSVGVSDFCYCPDLPGIVGTELLDKLELVIFKRGFNSLPFSYMMKGTGLTEFGIGTPRPQLNVSATLHHSAFDLASWDRMLLPFYAPI